MHYAGLLYRALNPIWAQAPLSGEGAARYGGRFNRIGRPALYTALDPATALREANQVGTLQPTTLIALRADVGPLLDGRDPQALAAFAITTADLADTAWRERMLRRQPVPTQDLAEAAVARGYFGIIAPSHARGAPPEALNIVLWQWQGLVTLVDDENRLGQKPI